MRRASIANVNPCEIFEAGFLSSYDQPSYLILFTILRDILKPLLKSYNLNRTRLYFEDSHDETLAKAYVGNICYCLLSFKEILPLFYLPSETVEEFKFHLVKLIQGGYILRRVNEYKGDSENAAELSKTAGELLENATDPKFANSKVIIFSLCVFAMMGVSFGWDSKKEHRLPS